jgi:hypothetical protein
VRTSRFGPVLLPILGAAAVLATPAAAVAQTAREPAEAVWTALRPLVGQWRGEGSGFGALSDVAHDWTFVVQGNFLELRTRSVPRAEDGEGEVHEDVGYLSYDKDTDAFVFRQFLSEGVVNTFDILVEDEGRTIRFDHRHTESGVACGPGCG